MEEYLTPKLLSNDEKKAAEAAFGGRPFNSAWSAHARLIYDGIMKALPKTDLPAVPELEPEILDVTPTISAGDEPELAQTEPVSLDTSQETEEARAIPTLADRQDAIQAGVLIDVTATAQGLGITFPIAITKPLWNVGIAADQTLTEVERAGRLRDVLMAFRLRLSSLVTVSPLIDFPALLALPPNTVPQPIPLFALFQPDEEHRATVTLLLPNEVAATIIPMN